MVQTITRQKLSGSTDGVQIKITGTATGSANTLHAVSGLSGSNYDEIWLFAFNTASTDRTLSLEFGTATDPVEIIIPAKGTASTDGYLNIVPGLALQGTVNVKAFASNANDLQVLGYINQIRA